MSNNKVLLDKALTTMFTIKDETKRLDYMLYTLTLLCNAKKAIFLDKKHIPKRGLGRIAWQKRQPFFVNNLQNDTRYSDKYEKFDKETSAALYFPVAYKKEYLGLFICTGQIAHSIIKDKIIPMKSGENTIGVTVKQVKTEVPSHQFSQEDIAALEYAVPHLLKAYYLEQENTSLAENRQKDRKSMLGTALKKMKDFLGGNT